MKKRREIFAADLFCGAGGTSEGLLMAANEMDADLTLIAINHWQVAIDTHSINHPYAKHLCTGLESVKPRELVLGGRLNVLCASPECTHHSVARGGRPMNDQSRSSAWLILHWAEQLYIESIIIENVPEFQSWGPLGANGRPMKSKRGHLFQQFVSSLKALGYNVEWRVLNCADYGDPTTRQRLFLIARRGGKAIKWPEPTHIPACKIAEGGLFSEDRKPWRTAREIIDWQTPSKSIFERKKPLAEKTLLRIQAGLKKFCGLDIDLRKCMAEDLRPFLVVFRNNQDAQSIDEPVPTLTTMGANVGLCEPFLAQWDQQGGSGAQRPVDSPVPTIVTKANTGLVEPFIVPQGRWNDTRTVDRPLDTVTTTSRGVGLIEPFIVPNFGERDGQSPRTHSVDSPAPAVTSHGAGGLVQPFMVTVNHGEGETPRPGLSVDYPMPTATSKIGAGICEPFLICYYGTNNMSDAGEPMPTVTTKDRFGLVEAEVTQYRLDIRFRMLQPRELARAQGFPDTYKFSGNREAVVKQIGNAVPPNTAKALILEALQ